MPYLDRFEILAKAEQWKEILTEGEAALNSAQKVEAKICAQLASSSFYLGDYAQALIYANRCHELAEKFTDPSLYIRALYLESAIYRAQNEFSRAVEIAEEALCQYLEKDLNNPILLGKVYFNLGAAHADNPIGSLAKAEHCYTEALQCTPSPDDFIRISLRLGKVYLLQKNFALSQQIIDQIRPQITTERLAMHADYLEAQLKLATGDKEAAIELAKIGLARAKALGAKQDESRLTALIRENP